MGPAVEELEKFSIVGSPDRRREEMVKRADREMEDNALYWYLKTVFVIACSVTSLQIRYGTERFYRPTELKKNLFPFCSFFYFSILTV